jgi:ankyrin repeat protein
VETGDVDIMTRVNNAISEAILTRPLPDYDAHLKSTRDGLLRSACSRGHADIVRWLLASVPDLNLYNALRAAWSHGYLDIVNMLIDAGADPHFEPDDSFFQQVVKRSTVASAMQAHGGNRQPLLDLLFSTGVWYDITSYDFWEFIGSSMPVSFLCDFLDETGDEMDDELWEAALTGACVADSPDTARYLLDVAEDRGIEVDINLLFGLALRTGHRETAELLFERFGTHAMSALSDTAGPNRFTSTDALMSAARCGSIAIVDELLGSDSRNHNSSELQFSQYSMFAALRGASDPEIISRLLDAKASVNISRGGTVLRGACEKLRPDGVRALLAAGAPVGSGVEGESALYYAVYAACPENRIEDKISIVNQLFDAGANMLDSRSTRTILHTGYDLSLAYCVISTILERKSGLVHCHYSNNLTPLMDVVGNPRKHLGMVRALLDAGADPLARDNDGKSVLQHLLSVNYTTKDKHIIDMCEIMRILLSVGADPTACFRDGETLLMRVVSLSSSRGIPEQSGLSDAFTDGARSTMLGYILEAIASRPAAVHGRE